MTFSSTPRADTTRTTPVRPARRRTLGALSLWTLVILAATGCYTQFQHPSDPYRREYPANPSSEVVYGWYYPSYGAYCDYYVVPWWHDHHYSHGSYYPPVDTDSPSLPRGTAFGRGGGRDGVDDRTSAPPPASVSVDPPPVRPSDPPANPPNSNGANTESSETTSETSGSSGRGGRK